ncbi:MAG: tetratricopeptide repeat protein [Myxococcota bacterium]
MRGGPYRGVTAVSGPCYRGARSRHPPMPEDTTKVDDWVFQPTVAEPPGAVAARDADAREASRVQGTAGNTPHDAQPDETDPELLGRFKIIGRLGRGGMGTVLEGYDETLDRRVAVKQLHADAGRSHRRRLLREAQALARLSHPNVVQVYDAGEQDGRLFIAMELVPGQTLWEWQRTPQPWLECLRVYTEAARGLAAAHAEGIVHRDFKPANCIIGDDGRVTVLDFGLARGIDDDDDDSQVQTLTRPGEGKTGLLAAAAGETKVETGADLPPPKPEPKPLVPGNTAFDSEVATLPRTPPSAGGTKRRPTDSNSALSQRLTRTGALLGTPAYMAPEQAAGLLPDARSDQFSLCVALFEALFGERPYGSSPGMALLVDEEPTLVIPKTRPGLPAVPGWLKAALTRGLHRDKDERFPNMNALIATLRRGQRQRRRRRLALALAGVGALMTAGVVASAREAPCEGMRDAGIVAWDQQRANVREALQAQGGEDAGSIWTATERGLDEYTRAWSEARARACEATHVERVASVERLERRTACLDGRAMRVQATVEQLAEADAMVAAHAAQAVRSLPRIEPCLDIEPGGPPPLPEALTADAEQVHRLIARSWAFDATGRAARGLDAAEAAVLQAIALGDAGAPLRAETQHNRGRLYRAVGRLSEARRDLEAVVEQAELSNDQSLAIEALRTLLMVALDEADRSAAAAWITVVQGKLRRSATHRPRHQAELNYLRGLLALHDQNYDDASESLEAATKAFDELGADATLAKGQALLKLAIARGYLHDDTRAGQTFEEALSLAEREGLRPLTAEVLHEQGRYHEQQGRHDEAETVLRRALALEVGFDGPNSPVTIRTRTVLARMLSRRGELDEAQRLVEAARKSLGPSVSARSRAQVMTLLASVVRMKGEWEVALGHYRRAHEAWSSLSSPDEIELAMLDTSMADCMMMMGHNDAAKARYETAIQILKVRAADDDPRHVYPLFGLGHALVELGDQPGAVDAYRRAQAIQAGVGENPELSAILRWELGRTVLGLDSSTDLERAEATRHVAAAREYYRSIDDADMVAEIDAFVSKRDQPQPDQQR